MNRIFLAGLLLSCSFRSFAAEPTFPPAPPSLVPPPVLTLGAQFSDGLRIQDFARVVLRDVLKSQFVFSADFLASDLYVGFSASSLKKHGSEALLRDVLAEHKFTLDYRAGYYRVTSYRSESQPDLRQDFVYRLKHRDLSYISAQLQPLFGSEGFTFKRNVDSSSAGARPEVKSGASTDGARPVDDGRSVFSMTTNTTADLLIFRGLSADISRLQGLLAQLDVPVPRVLVRALIIEARELEQSGFSVTGVASMLGGKLGLSIPGSSSGTSLTISGANFNSVVSALQGESSVRVLTAPSVFTQTGASASLSVGASVPTLGAIQYQSDGRTQQSVQYQDTGVILRVTPRVLDDSISLDVQQELSDAVQTSTGVSGSPTITKSSLSSSFTVRSGDTVVLGGLAASKDASVRDSLPFWRSLTLGSAQSSVRSDLVIILHVERI